MLKYALRRLAMFVPLMLGISVVVFLILHLLPGDPVEMMLGVESSRFSPEELESIRHQLGLSDPIYVQLLRWLAGVAQGDLGRSIKSSQPVTTMLARVVPYTVQLVAGAMALAVLGGMGLGLLAGTRRNSWVDQLSMLVSTIGISAPDFWLGLLLMFVFAVQLRWLPAIGEGGFAHLILPTITLGTSAVALVSRVTRSCVLEVMGEDYVTVARAKGLSEPLVLTRYVLRNALIPVVTILSLQIGRLIAGSIIIETVFARRGVGQLLIGSMLSKDFPVVQGAILFVSASVLTVNLVADLLYGLVDPRITH